MLSVFMLAIAVSLFGQVKFDLGIAGGVNFSKVSLDLDDYNTESVTKTHFGAFGRIGWNRIFIQPEVYYSGKGGNFSNVTGIMTEMDYKTVDIPVLLGLSVIKGKVIDLHLVGGPVFSNIVSKNIKGGNLVNEEFYRNNYFGIQYGVGIDVLFLTFDARMENGLGEFYTDPTKACKNNTFMLSVGFKLL